LLLPSSGISTSRGGGVLTVNSCIKVRLDLQVFRRSQGTLLPSSGEAKVSNPWNKCVMQKMI
jgi:hypothetical protein